MKTVMTIVFHMLKHYVETWKIYKGSNQISRDEN